MSRNELQKPFVRYFSAVVGGGLIALALLWFAWLLVRQVNPTMGSLAQPLAGSFLQALTPSPVNSDPLLAAGITLASPGQGQVSAFTKQQALLLAGQLEPAAAKAGSVTAVYTLFSYTAPNASQKSFHDAAIWLVHYSKVPEPHPDTSADPHAASASHDLYVFLDATSGQELLSLWL